MKTSEELRPTFEEFCVAELDDRESKYGDSWRKLKGYALVGECCQRAVRFDEAISRGELPSDSDLKAMVNYSLMILKNKHPEGLACRSTHGIGQRDMPDRGAAA